MIQSVRTSIGCAVVALVLALLCFPARAEQVGDTIVACGLCYEVQASDSSACLVGAVEDYGSGCVVIPPMVEGYRVTSIANGAFAQCQWLTAVSLPATITAIGDGAFDGCDALDTIFSHVPDASVVLPHVHDGATLAADCDIAESYSQQYDGIVKTLINVDSEPHSANQCDVNRDGVVNAGDITSAYNRLLGYSDDPCDADGDGVVTATDVTVIYNAMLAGNTSGVGDKGYCFATYDKRNHRAAVRVGESMRLGVGDEVSIVAHDNEQEAIVASGVGMMKGPLPWGGTESVDGIQALSLNNRQYNTGADAPVVMYFSGGVDTIYYKDVQVDVARHVVTDTLRVLSIGNSFSLDALSYVPFIMKAVAPEVYLKIGVMYIGAGSLEDFNNALDTNGFRYYWSYGAQPWDERVNVSMAEIIDSQPWDVITLQQMSSLSRDYSTYQPYLNQIIAWLDSHDSNGHERGWLITPSYPDGLDRLAPDTTSVQMFERIVESVQCVQRDTGIELLLPCGTAIQNARTTPLDSLGNFGHLFEYLHLQDGIPCLIEAYAATAALLARFGLSDRVWTDTTWVDQQWLSAKNVQEINGAPVGMSEENRAIAKQCAIKAIENPLSITVIE